MLFRDEETGMYIPLDVLALKLAPLLQPAPADVPDAPVEAERITALEHDIDDVCKERDWFMAQLHEAKQAQPTDSRLLAADKKRALAEVRQANEQLTAKVAEAQKTAQGWEFQWKTERSNSDFWKQRAATYEHQLADARQEVAMLVGTVQDLRAQLADANATAGRLACTIACMEQESAQLRRERDTYRAQADAARQAVTEAAQRAEAAEARLAAFYSPRPVYQD